MKKLFILTVCTFFIVPSINSISFAEEMMTWGEVISKGKVVATSHADVSSEVTFQWQHHMTVIYQKRVFFCTHNSGGYNDEQWISCKEAKE